MFKVTMEECSLLIIKCVYTVFENMQLFKNLYWLYITKLSSQLELNLILLFASLSSSNCVIKFHLCHRKFWGIHIYKVSRQFHSFGHSFIKQIFIEDWLCDIVLNSTVNICEQDKPCSYFQGTWILDLHYPIWQSLATSGCWAFEMRLVKTEMCFKCKAHTRYQRCRMKKII